MKKPIKGLRTPSGKPKSQYRGVQWLQTGKNSGRWRVICDATYVGHFTDEVEAAKEYDKYAKQWIGEKATLNFPEESTK